MDKRFEVWFRKQTQEKWEKTGYVCNLEMCFLAEIWQAAQPQWQPIETAPRDGSDILAYSSQSQEIIRWSDLSESWSLSYTFTHWMPLPPPPQQ